MSEKTRQMKEVRIPIISHGHDLTSFFLIICELQIIVKFVKTITVQGGNTTDDNPNMALSSFANGHH